MRNAIKKLRERSRRRDKPSQKKNELGKGAFDDALKCAQQLINEHEKRKLEVRESKSELEIFKDDCQSVQSLNEDLRRKILEIEEIVEKKEEKIQNLDKKLKEISEECREIREESETVKARSEETDNHLKQLAHRISEVSKVRNIAEKQLTEKIEENEIIQQESMKLEISLSQKDDEFNEMKRQVQCLHEEILEKQKMIQNLDQKCKQMYQQNDLQTGLQNMTQQQYLLAEENKYLKTKMGHYGEKEIGYQKKIMFLEKELQMRSGNELKRSLRKEFEGHEKLNNQNVKPVRRKIYDNRNISQTRNQINNTLKELADSEKNRKRLLLDMKTTRMERKEQILQAKYDDSQLARDARATRKLNIISVAKDERHALLTRLHKLEEENKKLAAENEEASLDTNVCRDENTRLIGRVRKYEDELNCLNDAIMDKEVRREENTKLVKRMQVYQEKLKSLGSEIAAKEEFQRKCVELQQDSQEFKFRLEAAENEKVRMEKTINTLTNDIDFYRKSSIMLSNSSCCLELKVSKQEVEKKVKQLEIHIVNLEAKVKISFDNEDRLQTLQQSLVVSKRDLQTTQKKLDFCKQDLHEVEQDNKELQHRLAKENRGNSKTSAEQPPPPNVNVHVHLDPQKFLGHSVNINTTDQEILQKDNAVTMPPLSSHTSKQIQGLMDKIKMLNQHIEKLEKELQQSTNVIDAKDNDDSCSKDEKAAMEKAAMEKFEKLTKEKQILLQKQQVLLQENKDLSTQKSALESELQNCRKRIEELESVELEMQDDMTNLVETFKTFKATSADKETGLKSEIDEMRKKIQTQYANDDMESLRNRINDFAMKKEKNEALIVKLKEDKADLQMNVQRLERELENIADQLDFTHTDRGKQRRNAEPLIGEENCVPVQQSTPNKKKANFPAWLDSATNNDKDMASRIDSATDHGSRILTNVADGQGIPKQQKSSTPIWLTTAKEPEIEKDDGETKIIETKGRRRTVTKTTDDDDDFLGIKSAASQRVSKANDDSDDYLGRLDTSNRRHVPKRNASATKNNVENDDEYLGNFNDTRRGKPIAQPKKVEAQKVETIKQTEKIDPAENFLQQFKPKQKKEDPGLDFLRLDDTPKKPAMKKQSLPINNRPKPMKNAQFLI